MSQVRAVSHSNECVEFASVVLRSVSLQDQIARASVSARKLACVCMRVGGVMYECLCVFVCVCVCVSVCTGVFQPPRALSGVVVCTTVVLTPLSCVCVCVCLCVSVYVRTWVGV